MSKNIFKVPLHLKPFQAIPPVIVSPVGRSKRIAHIGVGMGRYGAITGIITRCSLIIREVNYTFPEPLPLGSTCPGCGSAEDFAGLHCVKANGQ